MRKNQTGASLGIIPRPEFNRLRKYVLDYLKRNSDANGYCHIQHDSLQSIIMYAKDCRPFAGMSPYAREQATNRFWEALLKAKLVEMVMSPVTLEGHEKPHYYLPGTKPFHDSSLPLIEEVRAQRKLWEK